MTLNDSSPPAGGCQMERSSSESVAQAADESAAAREVPSWLTIMAATHIGRFMRWRADECGRVEVQRKARLHVLQQRSSYV